MSDIDNPTRASLQRLADKIFKLVSRGATSKQWAEWLRVPLEHAAADGDIDLFNALIGAGADASAGWRGCQGRTLFDAAAEGGNAEVVSGLVAAGAQLDVDVVSTAPKRSALYLATTLGHEDAARRLVSAGADVDFYDTKDACHVLFKAAERGLEDLVDDLLDGGADQDPIAWPGTTLFHVAAESGSEGVVSALLARGEDTDAIDCEDKTPLIEAAGSGHLAVVNSLLAAGADVGIRDDEGHTALEVASGRGCVEVLKAMIAHGADVDAAGEFGGAAMHFAAEKGQAGAIDVLIEAGADIELTNLFGWTPLFEAAHDGQWRAVRRLLRHGANARVRDMEGNTPLHDACGIKPARLDTIVDLLLRSGAEEATVNNFDYTPAQELESPPPWQCACSQEELERARLLLARAPNDRAWRRRCWLVMLRSRDSRARTAGCENGEVSGHGSNVAGGHGEGTLSKMAKSERAGGGESGVVGQAGSGCAIGFGYEVGSLGDVVASLIGLELEGVFRTVMGFL